MMPSKQTSTSKQHGHGTNSLGRKKIGREAGHLEPSARKALQCPLQSMNMPRPTVGTELANLNPGGELH